VIKQRFEELAMSREDFDIPEVFRRAMEEAGWDNGKRRRDDQGGGDGGNDGGDGGGGRRPSSGNRPSNRVLLLAAVFIVLLLSVNFIVSTVTELFWFQALGYDDVWLRQWVFRIGSFVLFFPHRLGILTAAQLAVGPAAGYSVKRSLTRRSCRFPPSNG
jgi:hypothetical protein